LDLDEKGLEGVEWTHLAQYRNQGRALVTKATNLWVLYHERVEIC